MTSLAAELAGGLTLAPGAADAIIGRRPVIGAALLRRLTDGLPASLLPERVGAVFALCGCAQRATAQQAVAAARTGEPSDPGPAAAATAAAPAARDPAAASVDRLLALSAAREHLQRFALDAPRLVPQPGIALDPAWLRATPLHALPGSAAGAGDAALQAAAAALPGWLERALLGMPPALWLRRWHDDPAAWLAEWAGGSRHPLARWLAAVRPAAERLRLPCRPLGLLDDGADGLRAIAAALAADAGFAERPTWRALPAETGPWTRAGRGAPPGPGFSAWHRLGARIADLAALAGGAPLARGALALAPGEAIAWSETARGLLLHWVRLRATPAHAADAPVERFRVVAPTEWNFHPDGALGAALRAGALDAAGARLAALALDPCVAFEVAEACDA